GDAEKRRSHVRAVVHILCEERTLLPIAAANHSDRIDIEQQRGSRALGRGLGIEDMDLAKAQVETLKSIRMLVEQVTEIAGGFMLGSDREQHGRIGGGAMKSWKGNWST